MPLMTLFKDTRKLAYIAMHIAVLAFGFTAILGALILLDPISLVWWRLLFTLVSFLLIFRFTKSDFKLEKKVLLRCFLSGAVICAHWICFYASIKLANASVAVVVLSTMPLFTALLGPLVNKSSFEIIQVLVGVLILVGMYLIFSFSAKEFHLGIWVGLLSAFLSSLFTVINKELLDIVPIKSLSFVQLASAFFILTVIIPILSRTTFPLNFMPVGSDWIYLLILATFCTTMAFLLSAFALKILTPYIVNLTINLEPIYGVVLAIFLLHENKELNWGFYFGMLIILLAVFIYPIFYYYKKKKNKAQSTFTI